MGVMRAFIFDNDIIGPMSDRGLVDKMNALYLALDDPDAAFEVGCSLIEGRDTDSKLYGLRVLEAVRDRRVFPVLIDKLPDDDITTHIIGALASIRDSRALFPLINFTRGSDRPEVWQRTLQYMYATKDPRAEEFLADYLMTSDCMYPEIAGSALAVCKDNHDFLYRYNGSDDERRDALEAAGQILVSAENLSKNTHILQRNKSDSFYRPQTYVICEDKNMHIGGDLHEHVMVAKGKDVLAAGEVDFIERGGVWKVSYVNSRSCGFFPSASCFHWVKSFFEGSDVRFDHDEFDDRFPRDGFNDEDFLSIFRYGANYR